MKNRTARLIAAFTVGAGLTTQALAQSPRETVTFTLVPSDGPANSAANAIRTNTFVGGYPLGRINFTGTLTSLNTHTWRTDSRILITLPDSTTMTFQPFTSGTTFTSLSVSGSRFVNAGSNPAGPWTFRFYEAFDDGGVGVQDARWDITVQLTDDPPVAPSSTTLGTLLAPGQTIASASLSNGQVLWYKFTIPWAAQSSLRTYVDIDTFGSFINANSGSNQIANDTQLALYDAAGTLVASDDDNGPGVTSQLSFGWGGRTARAGGEPYDGRNGSLPAGTYYLAVGGFQMGVQPQYWGAAPISNRNGTVTLNFATNLSATAPVCYANCDASTFAPILTANDFQCFLNAFAGAQGYANCDGSTVNPILTANDFQCFLNAVAAGCP